MREREIKKIGNSYFVRLYPVDLKDLGLEVGDKVGVVNLEEE